MKARGCAVLLFFVLSCEAKPGAGGLSRSQCADLVRRIQKLESADTGGLETALQAAHGASVDECLEHANERSLRCVMQADSKADLESCELLFE